MTGQTGTGLRGRHLLGIADLAAEEITLVLDTAEAMKEVAARPIKKVPTLRGKTIVNLFYEPSTRTRTSFEIAEKRLSADTLNIAVSTSSVVKGETLADTVMNLEAMAPDMIVMRHASSGACHLLARICRARVINAGDGMHEHPTQALGDALTVLERKGRLSDLRVAIVGDVLHSRVARSNAWLFSKLGNEVRFVGPRTLMPAHGAMLPANIYYDLEEGIDNADVVMCLRLQKERMEGTALSSIAEYAKLYQVNARSLRYAAPDCLVMHPGPLNRGVEVDDLAADGEQSAITQQVENGIFVRMAGLYWAFGGKRKSRSEGPKKPAAKPKATKTKAKA